MIYLQYRSFFNYNVQFKFVCVKQQFEVCPQLWCYLGTSNICCFLHLMWVICLEIGAFFVIMFISYQKKAYTKKWIILKLHSVISIALKIAYLKSVLTNNTFLFYRDSSAVHSWNDRIFSLSMTNMTQCENFWLSNCLIQADRTLYR